jgi:hypothetical protein
MWESFKKVIANKNMKTGPIIQFSINEADNTLRLENTSPILSYFTFAKGGYIIKIKPIANGILVVPLDNELIHWRIWIKMSYSNTNKHRQKYPKC